MASGCGRERLIVRADVEHIKRSREWTTSHSGVPAAWPDRLHHWYAWDDLAHPPSENPP